MRLLPAVLLAWFVSSSTCPNSPPACCKVRQLQSGFDGDSPSGSGILFCLAEYLGRNRKMVSAPRGVRNGRPCCGAMLAGPSLARHVGYHSVHFKTHQSFAFY